MQKWNNGQQSSGIIALMLLLTMTLSVSGCGAFTRETTVSDCCIHLSPIYFSLDDTEETQEQIIDYLVVYQELCGGLDGD